MPQIDLTSMNFMPKFAISTKSAERRQILHKRGNSTCVNDNMTPLSMSKNTSTQHDHLPLELLEPLLK